MQFHNNFCLIYLISRVFFPGLFKIFWPAVYFTKKNRKISVPLSSFKCTKVSIRPMSIAPPTIPALASSLELVRARVMNMFLCPVLPILSRPSDLKFREIQSTLPITFPMFMWTLSSLKFRAKITKVSQE